VRAIRILRAQRAFFAAARPLKLIVRGPFVTAHQTAALALRLFAIWLGIQALGYLPAFRVFPHIVAGKLAPSAEPQSHRPATPDTVLASINPIDYEAILQREGTDDLIANVMAISGSLRAILGSIENGHGLLSELVRGDDANEPKDRLTLQSIQRTLDHVDKLSVALGSAMDRVNSGQGLVGAMLSDQTNGKQFLDNIEQTTVKLRQTSARLDTLIARFDKANGILPQLMENKNFSDDVLPNLRQSSHDLKDILQKINLGRGTAGLMVNNPALYNQLTSFMDNGGGWGIRFINGFYNLTHPLASPSPGNVAQPVMLTTSQAGACIEQPASTTTAVSAIPAVAAPTASLDGLSETK